MRLNIAVLTDSSLFDSIKEWSFDEKELEEKDRCKGR